MPTAEDYDINTKRFIPLLAKEGNVAFDNEILRSTVGSELHGTGIPGVEDHDEMGIYIEPANYVLGFQEMEHYTWRSKPEGVKSEHGDTDLVMYSLRKFMSLAMQGNPTVLLLLFSPEPYRSYATDDGLILQGLAPYIVSKRCAPRFEGYLRSQYMRLTGEKQGHVPSRPELVEKFGYDTKYAMHALRLAIQGIEILSTGRIELPVPAEEREFLFAVRQGQFTYDQVLVMLEQYMKQLELAKEKSKIREHPEIAVLEPWLISTYRRHWRRLDEI